MRKWTRGLAAILLTGTVAAGGCGRGHAASRGYGSGATYGSTAPAAAADTAPYHHHSILGGAAAGAVAGHYAGHHAVAGAVVGAIVQHERNKHHR